MPEVKELSLEETAATCWRVWCLASGVTCQDWDHLPVALQTAWLRLARGAEFILEALDGWSFQSIAEEFAKVYSKGEQAPQDITCLLSSPRSMIAMQAVARHVWQLVDSEEVEDLEALEQSWAGWAEARRLQLVARSDQ